MPGFIYDGSALFITRGAKLIAEGTATNPIIFTSYYDDLDDACDYGPGASGLWGGLVLLGNAPITTAGGQTQIEGAIGTEFPWSYYGGSDAADSSGVLKYISLRHGGVEIASAMELNGLTMGGVGNKTVIENIEVYANLDDGFEWFGGTVNCKYLIAAFVGDDAFDYDDGYMGKGQFWFSIHRHQIGYSGAGNPGNSSGEFDGMTKAGEPYAMLSEPTIYNATFIGNGITSAGTNEGYSVRYKDVAGGHLRNVFMADFSSKAVSISGSSKSVDMGGGVMANKSSKDQLIAGKLTIKNSVFAGFGAGNTFATMMGETWTADSLSMASWGNAIVTLNDSTIRGISRECCENSKLDPRASVGGKLLSGYAVPPSDGFYTTSVNYIGAFGTQLMWFKGWTELDQSGIAAKYLYHVPVSQTMTDKQAFDWVVVLNMPSVSITGGSLLFDGVQQISSWNVVKLTEPLIMGGTSYRFGGMHVYLNAITGKKVGKHTMDMSLTLNNGMTVTDKATWKIIDAQ
jgi:hypothetical protein